MALSPHQHLAFTGLHMHTPPLHHPHPPPRLQPHELQTLQGQEVTLVGFGSLLSEISSRTTFPTLQNFRLGRVKVCVCSGGGRACVGILCTVCTRFTNILLLCTTGLPARVSAPGRDFLRKRHVS